MTIRFYIRPIAIGSHQSYGFLLCSPIPRISMANVTEYVDFKSNYYLAKRYKDMTNETRIHFILRFYHEPFQTLPYSLNILEFGCGPIIQHSISAAAHASEVVFSDIVASNREAVKKWLRKDPAAFNWSPHFDYVVQTLEGKGEKEAREREETLRKVVKGVVHCDVLEDSVIQKGFEGPYDVIIEQGCLVAACPTPESFKLYLERLTRLLKPGGRMVTCFAACDMKERTTHYTVGGKLYHSVCIDRDFLREGLKEVDFTIEHMKFCSSDSTFGKSTEVVFAMSVKN